MNEQLENQISFLESQKKYLTLQKDKIKEKNIGKNRTNHVLKANNTLNAKINTLSDLQKVLFLYQKESNEFKQKFESLTYNQNILSSPYHLLKEEEFEYLQKHSFYLKANPAFIFYFITKLPPPPVSIQKLINNADLFQPEKPLKKGFGYDEELKKVVTPKFRYLFNMKVSNVIKYLEKTEVSKDVEYNSKLFLQLAYQGRWGTIWQQILSLFFYMDQVTEKFALCNTAFPDLSDKIRSAEDLITLQTIGALLSKFSVLPFYNVADNLVIERANGVEWGTCLIPLLFSLLELSIEEKGFNVRSDSIIPLIEDRLIAAQTSFETVMLDNKGVFSDIFKNLTILPKHYVRVNHVRGDAYPTYFTSSENDEIVFAHENLDANWSNFTKKVNPKIVVWITKQMSILRNSNDPWKTSEHLRYLLTYLMIAGNPGIYYKTDLVLEKVKSIEPQVNTILSLPQPKSYITLEDIEMIHELDWNTADPIWSKVIQLYEIKLDAILSELERINFEETYVDFLTYNSQGQKVTLAEYDPQVQTKKDDERSRILLSINQARIAAFLLDLPSFYDLEKFLQRLNEIGICTTRFQNNRRARVVEIVSNSQQVAYAIVLAAYNEIKTKFEEVAIGKQQGGVTDMKKQLLASGQINNVLLSSDVAGMDASSSPMVTSLIPLALASYIDKHQLGPSKYFGFTDKEVIVKKVTGENGKIKIKALSQAIRLIVSHDQRKMYQLKSKVFNSEINVNPQILFSGRLDTGAQNTEMVIDLVKITNQVAKTSAPSKGLLFQPVSDELALGDDQLTILKFGSSLKIKEQVDHYLEVEKETFRRLGFVIEPVASTMFGDFLQQMALLGAVVMKSARTSVYTDERGNTRDRNPIAQIRIMVDVYTTASQRTYAPENVIVNARATWQLIRTARVFETRGLTGKDSRWAKYLTIVGTREYFSFPYILISLHPINFISQSWEIKFSENSKVIVPATSNLWTVGDAKLVWLITSTLTPTEHKLATNLFTEPVEGYNIKVGDTYTLDVAETCLDRWKNFQINDSIILLSFNPNSILSREREVVLEQDIDKMSTALADFYDPTKMRDSVMAWYELSNRFGVKVPTKLAYWARPKEKVVDMFTNATISEIEQSKINEGFVRFLYTSGRIGFEKKFKRDIIKGGFIVNFNGDRTTQDIDHLPRFPLIPGYRPLSDWNSYLQIAGSSLRDNSIISRSFIGLLNKYGRGFDLELALRFGARIKSMGPGVLGLFGQTLGLNTELSEELLSLITDDTMLAQLDAYQSGFQPSNLFGISGSVNNFITDIKVLNLASEQSINLGRIVCRDMLLMGIHLWKGKMPIVMSSLQTALTLDGIGYVRDLGVAVSS